jgi:hypothetical protein
VLKRLRDRARTLQPGEWLLTLGGWHTDQLCGDRSDLALAELDAVAPGNPAFIQVGYSHAFVNSALLRAIGPDIPGLVPGTGRVNGVLAAAEGGWPVQTHSVTGEGLDLVLAAYERASARRPVRALRWSLTHAEGITAAQLERARRLGVTLQVRSMSVIGGQDQPAAVHGTSAARMPPLRTIADSGLPWGLGTDGCKAAQVNPFTTLWWAVTGQALGGDTALNPGLTVSREEALIAHTRSNAWLAFQEGYTGAIRPGMRADMVVLDRDYLTVPAAEIKDIAPVATLVEGKVVFGSL